MAHAPARHGVGDGAKISVFWRFSAVFDPILEGTRTTGHGPQNTGFRSRRTVDGPVAGDRCQWSRLPDWRAGDRLPTGHGFRSGKFGAMGAGHGAASLTLLTGQRRPVSGHKKSPAGNVPAGRLSACVGLIRLLDHHH